MLEFLKGKLSYVEIDYIVIEVNGVGYKLFVPNNSSWGKIDSEIMVYTYMSVREDDISLYGFKERKTLSFFKILLQVSGIGPKVALAIIASFNLDILHQAIIEEDVTLLSKIPGIGKKTAKRMILELKDKVSQESVMAGNHEVMVDDKKINSIEAQVALEELGYNAKEIRDVILKITDNNKNSLTVEEIIKQSLKMLAKI
ncbi:Holliday junction DNA helicase RuvA [Desulfitispora alkaliphila]|uniref:Holliday junction branch migration protein RuvA n=1 Tax=Desulfitispora alkaliphila TaxID=622674 RepID=UPI003D1EFA8C